MTTEIPKQSPALLKVAMVHQSMGGEHMRTGMEIAKNKRGVRVDA